MQQFSPLQEVERKYIDYGKNNSDARKMVGLINKLYQKQHRHKDAESKPV